MNWTEQRWAELKWRSIDIVLHHSHRHIDNYCDSKEQKQNEKKKCIFIKSWDQVCSHSFISHHTNRNIWFFFFFLFSFIQRQQSSLTNEMCSIIVRNEIKRTNCDSQRERERENENRKLIIFLIYHHSLDKLKGNTIYLHYICSFV